MYATPQFVIFPHTTQGFGGSKWTTQPTSSIIFPFLFKIRALKKGNHLEPEKYPTTASLHVLIPQIWLKKIERNLVRRYKELYDLLTPEEKAELERRRKRRQHYKKKIAWTKAHPKKKRRY